MPPYTNEQIEQIIEKAVTHAMAATNERQHVLEELVEKHEHLLYGNGREGVTTKLDRIERAVTSWQRLGWRIVEVMVITGVIGLVVLLVQAGLWKM